MKAFLLAVIAVVVITFGSNLILEQIGFSAADVTTSSDNVRLSD